MTVRHSPSWWWSYLNLQAAQVFYVDLNPGGVALATAESWLDSSEHERSGRFMVDHARRHYCLCRAALRANLCRILGCSNEQLSFHYLQHGKPVAMVDGRRVSAGFNVSHSGDHGLLAFGRSSDLGVDLEIRNTTTDVISLSESVFSPGEQSKLLATQPESRRRLFFRLWTMKEALIKALGTGFSLDPASFDVPKTILAGEREGIFRFPKLPARRWYLADIGEPRFAAAIAWEIGDDDQGSSRL